jgi:IS30 family transposase
MIKWKTQIHEGELHEIRVLLVEGYSIPKIAEKLGRSKSTLYRLFQNNGIEYKQRRFQYIWWKKWNREKDYVIRVDGISQVALFRENGRRKPQFFPHHVYLLRERRRSLASRRYSRVEPWGKLENYILEKIKNTWSPKQISGRWRLETLEKLSKDTVYRYIYSHHKELIRKYFRRKWKSYCNHRGNRFNGKYQLMDRRMIDERQDIYPKCETRTEIWHWEWDTVVWIRWWSKEVILTNVERKTWYLLARKLKRGTGQCVSEATRRLFNTPHIPAHKKQLLHMTMEESFLNIGWLNMKQRWSYSLLIHTTHGNDEPMRIPTDYSDSSSQRKQTSNIQQKNNFNIIQSSSIIGPGNDYDG